MATRPNWAKGAVRQVLVVLTSLASGSISPSRSLPGQRRSQCLPLPMWTATPPHAAVALATGRTNAVSAFELYPFALQQEMGCGGGDRRDPSTFVGVPGKPDRHEIMQPESSAWSGANRAGYVGTC